MKIGAITNINAINSYQTTKAAANRAKVPGGRDEVVFSKEALGMTKFKAEIESRTVEEKARIGDITTAVRQGDYRVSSDKIADRILESVLRR